MKQSQTSRRKNSIVENNQLVQRGEWRLDGFTSTQKENFAAVFSECGDIGDTCARVGISRATYEYHRKQDQWFQSLLEAARQMHCDDLEGVMLKRGLNPKGTADRIQYLKAYRPGKHGGKSDEQKPAVEININLSEQEMEEYKKRAIDLGQA